MCVPARSAQTQPPARPGLPRHHGRISVEDGVCRPYQEANRVPITRPADWSIHPRSKALEPSAPKSDVSPNVYEGKAREREKDLKGCRLGRVDRNSNGNQEHSWQPHKILRRRFGLFFLMIRPPPRV